ncbi:helix-turn-helix domain-containing protein [Actinomadura xylanilytica]|uniref:helix-turn-helix domain-containing protein n=1 Tax=Actinomadura xylanilytica TaxID=887459 RepID=UPI00255A7D59|nr:helix-turn-helix domain-containing protein [Actinomadura xylanilytica]MDL4773406.1 helix-turn-helix domain-containing protein [Actinomadura xylanilytica]
MPGPGNVGERVRNLRLTRRLSQAQLAGHDLSDSYISLIESGKRTPTPTVLRMLAERLGCTPEYLAEGVEPEQRAHLEVRERHAHLALLAGDPATAEAGFDDVIDRSDDPDLTSRARWGRARALEELGRTGQAITLFEELREQAERDPGRASWLPPVIALARCYHAVGDLGQAIALGERALDRLRGLGLDVGVEHAEVGRILLLAYVDRSDPERAHALGRRLLVSAPDESPADAYQRASIRALEGGAIGDSLHLADKALAARTEGTPPQSRARLDLAAAKALLRGVPPFSVPPSIADTGMGGTFAVAGSAELARPRAEGTPEAAAEAFELLRQTTSLDGVEGTEATIAKARALVLMGDPAQAIAGLEEFLETGMALAAPTADGSPTAVPEPVVTPRPDAGLPARTHKTVLARLVLARARIAQGDRTAAQVVLGIAAEQLAGLAPGRTAAGLFREQGELFELVGDPDSAAAAYRRGLEAVGLCSARSQAADRDLGRV